MSYNSSLQSNNINLQSILDKINTLPDSGNGESGAMEWSENEDAIISKTITSYMNDRVTNIGRYVFTSCNSLTTVSFPTCTVIGSSAFQLCSRLTTVSFPTCRTIEDNAFYRCESLTIATFSKCTRVENAAFFGCSSLTMASFPVCEHLGSSAFQNCYNLATAFFPMCISIFNNTFDNCRNLTTASFPICNRIDHNAFAHNYRLSSLFLGASSVCTLYYSIAFTSTPFAGYSSYFSGTPYIYVPASLVDAYKSATNWTYFSSYFSSIESLERGNIITFTIGGTTYEAEEGMTWEELAESDYLISSKLRIESSSVFYISSYTVQKVTYNNLFVELTDQIINGARYGLYAGEEEEM